MAEQENFQKRSFELSMLIYDTRYRSTSIQVIALLIFFSFVVWLINNTAANMAVSGKDIDFSFLFNQSGYDINQKFLEYNSQSTHLRAAVLGVMNTLVLSAMGCITATILGVIVGIARLSKNWIVSRIMAVYIEIFRNVPLLLWIILVMAVTVESFPRPNAFRGADPSATMKLFDSVALTNRGIYLPEPLFSKGLGDIALFSNSFSISLDLMVILFVLISSILCIKKIKKRASRIQEATGERPTTWYWVISVLVIPTFIVLVILGFYLGYPELKGFNFKGGMVIRPEFIAMFLALSIYTGAFISETVRSGILSVTKGQREASAAIGLKPTWIMRLIIIPQALRVIVPPLTSQYLNLTKNSSLGIAVGYADLVHGFGGISLNQTGQAIECMVITMATYLAISLIISFFMNIYNKSIQFKEK